MVILVANGPRMYREALGHAIRRSRPLDRIVLAEPANLQAAVAHLEPQVVLCDPHVHDTAGRRVWIQLDGVGSATKDLGLDELLAAVQLAGADSEGER